MDHDSVNSNIICHQSEGTAALQSSNEIRLSSLPPNDTIITDTSQVTEGNKTAWNIACSPTGGKIAAEDHTSANDFMDPTNDQKINAVDGIESSEAMTGNVETISLAVLATIEGCSVTVQELAQSADSTSVTQLEPVSEKLGKSTLEVTPVEVAIASAEKAITPAEKVITLEVATTEKSIILEATPVEKAITLEVTPAEKTITLELNTKMTDTTDSASPTESDPTVTTDPVSAASNSNPTPIRPSRLSARRGGIFSTARRLGPSLAPTPTTTAERQTSSGTTPGLTRSTPCTRRRGPAPPISGAAGSSKTTPHILSPPPPPFMNGGGGSGLKEKSGGHRNGRGIDKSHAELFRKDLISAMKLADTEVLQPGEYHQISDTWKLEWEKGVQVPLDPEAITTPNITIVQNYPPSGHEDEPFIQIPNRMLHAYMDEHYNPDEHVLHDMRPRGFTMEGTEEGASRYDLDDLDVAWLTGYNELRACMGERAIREGEMEQIIDELESFCHEKLQLAIRTVDGLGIEYDENVVCDVCRSPDGDDGNEMVFCDACDICVHQSCYGIPKIPEGYWMCRPCALGLTPRCVLCPRSGGAMKIASCGTRWAHIACAWWIPEVSFSCLERMEPISNISVIPQSRWALVCYLCRERTGACIQCAYKTCKTSFHVTCAYSEGLEMSETPVTSEEKKQPYQLMAYCRKHSEFASKEDDSGDQCDKPIVRNGGGGGKQRGSKNGGKAVERLIRENKECKDGDKSLRKHKECTYVDRSLGENKECKEVERLLQEGKVKHDEEEQLFIDSDKLQISKLFSEMERSNVSSDKLSVKLEPPSADIGLDNKDVKNSDLSASEGVGEKVQSLDCGAAVQNQCKEENGNSCDLVKETDSHCSKSLKLHTTNDDEVTEPLVQAKRDIPSVAIGNNDSSHCSTDDIPTYKECVNKDLLDLSVGPELIVTVTVCDSQASKYSELRLEYNSSESILTESAPAGVAVNTCAADIVTDNKQEIINDLNAKLASDTTSHDSSKISSGTKLSSDVIATDDMSSLHNANSSIDPKSSFDINTLGLEHVSTNDGSKNCAESPITTTRDTKFEKLPSKEKTSPPCSPNKTSLDSKITKCKESPNRARTSSSQGLVNETAHDGKSVEGKMSEEERTELRSHRLKRLGEEFYEHVSPRDVAKRLGADLETVDFIYNYWLLKRRSRSNRPLLDPKIDDGTCNPDLVKQVNEDSSLAARANMFIHLRQDLERVRNLCYMVNKRERTRAHLYRLKEDIFNAQLAHIDSLMVDLDPEEGILMPRSEGRKDESGILTWGDDMLDILLSEGHKMTGTFYDDSAGILNAARLMDLKATVSAALCVGGSAVNPATPPSKNSGGSRSKAKSDGVSKVSSKFGIETAGSRGTDSGVDDGSMGGTGDAVSDKVNSIKKVCSRKRRRPGEESEMKPSGEELSGEIDKEKTKSKAKVARIESKTKSSATLCVIDKQSEKITETKDSGTEVVDDINAKKVLTDSNKKPPRPTTKKELSEAASKESDKKKTLADVSNALPDVNKKSSLKVRGKPAESESKASSETDKEAEKGAEEMDEDKLLMRESSEGVKTRTKTKPDTIIQILTDKTTPKSNRKSFGDSTASVNDGIKKAQSHSAKSKPITLKESPNIYNRTFISFRTTSRSERQARSALKTSIELENPSSMPAAIESSSEVLVSRSTGSDTTALVAGSVSVSTGLNVIRSKEEISAAKKDDRTPIGGLRPASSRAKRSDTKITASLTKTDHDAESSDKIKKKDENVQIGENGESHVADQLMPVVGDFDAVVDKKQVEAGAASVEANIDFAEAAAVKSVQKSTSSRVTPSTRKNRAARGKAAVPVDKQTVDAENNPNIDKLDYVPSVVVGDAALNARDINVHISSDDRTVAAKSDLFRSAFVRPDVVECSLPPPQRSIPPESSQCEPIVKPPVVKDSVSMTTLNFLKNLTPGQLIISENIKLKVQNGLAELARQSQLSFALIQQNKKELAETVFTPVVQDHSALQRKRQPVITEQALVSRTDKIVGHEKLVVSKELAGRTANRIKQREDRRALRIAQLRRGSRDRSADVQGSGKKQEGFSRGTDGNTGAGERRLLSRLKQDGIVSSDGSDSGKDRRTVTIVLSDSDDDDDDVKVFRDDEDDEDFIPSSDAGDDICSVDTDMTEDM